MMNAFEDLSKSNKEMMDSALKSYAAMTKNIQAIASEATDYSKSSYEAGAAAFEKLAASKSIEKAMEVQSDYVKTSYEGMVAQATKMGELYADLAKEAYKPFESMVPASK